MAEDYPKVGIGVMLCKGDNVLLSKRKGSHGEGEYAFPGGHLEFGESFEACARRETKEESDVEIENIRFQYLANVKKYGGKHYVHIGLIADWKSGEPKNLEPQKSEGWKWYPLNDLPQPMFEMCRLSFESYKTGKNYFDS
jgi:8-oxo-dGTP diphosphatase